MFITDPFSFFSITGWGTDLDYCDIEWVALETNTDHSIFFEISPNYCILASGYLHTLTFYLLSGFSQGIRIIHPTPNLPALYFIPTGGWGGGVVNNLGKEWNAELCALPPQAG